MSPSPFNQLRETQVLLWSPKKSPGAAPYQQREPDRQVYRTVRFLSLKTALLYYFFVFLDELTLRLGHRRGSGNGECLPSNPVHQRLRDGSPLTVALDTRRRHGQQLALSSLVHAFIAMHKISVGFKITN